jgi:hypothetical protein
MDRWQENTEFGILSYIILTLPWLFQVKFKQLLFSS